MKLPKTWPGRQDVHGELLVRFSSVVVGIVSNAHLRFPIDLEPSRDGPSQATINSHINTVQTYLAIVCLLNRGRFTLDIYKIKWTLKYNACANVECAMINNNNSFSKFNLHIYTYSYCVQKKYSIGAEKLMLYNAIQNSVISKQSFYFIFNYFN